MKLEGVLAVTFGKSLACQSGVILQAGVLSERGGICPAIMNKMVAKAMN